MGLAFVRLFGDHREKVKIAGRNLKPGFLKGLADGAFKGGLARPGLKFAADGAPDPEIRRFRAQQEQEFAPWFSRKTRTAIL